MNRDTKWLLSSLIAIVLAFFAGAGAVENHVIPSTLAAHPVLTWQMMHRYPIGAEVVMADETDKDKVDFFATQGWYKDPIFGNARVTDYVYETGFDAKDRPRLNLTLDVGANQIHSLHPDFVRVLPPGHMGTK